ncbi:hypothetical protein ACQP1W_28680 [Spirillospora sp. CA-255316]
MSESSQTQSVVVLDPSQESTARAVAAAHGVEVESVPRRGVEPVATVTLVLVGTVAAVGTVLHVLEQRKGGQVVDLRPGAPKALYRTPDVVYGTVIIVTADDKVTVEVKEPEGMFGKVIAALPELLAGDGGGIEQVTKAVTDVFGSDVEVKSVEAPSPGGDV